MAVRTQKNKIKYLLFHEEFCYASEIYQLFQSGSLRFLLKSLEQTNTTVCLTSISRKRKLTCEEQFLQLLDRFFVFFNQKFFFIKHNRNILISSILESTYADVFLRKGYYHDYRYMEQYIFGFKQLIVSNFYYNLLFLKDYLSVELQEMFLDPTNLTLQYEEDVQFLFSTLQKLILAYDESFHSYFLVKNIMVRISEIKREYIHDSHLCELRIEQTISQYQMFWKEIFKQFLEKKDCISKVFTIL